MTRIIAGAIKITLAALGCLALIQASPVGFVAAAVLGVAAAAGAVYCSPEACDWIGCHLCAHATAVREYQQTRKRLLATWMNWEVR